MKIKIRNYSLLLLFLIVQISCQSPTPIPEPTTLSGRSQMELFSFPPELFPTHEALNILYWLDAVPTSAEKEALGEWVINRFDTQTVTFKKDFGISAAHALYLGTNLLMLLDKPLPTTPENIAAKLQTFHREQGYYKSEITEDLPDPGPYTLDSYAALKTFNLLQLPIPESEKTLSWLHKSWEFYKALNIEQQISGLSVVATMIYFVDHDQVAAKERWLTVLELWNSYHALANEPDYTKGLDFIHISALIELAELVEADRSWLPKPYVQELLSMQVSDGGYPLFPTEDGRSDWSGTWSAAQISHYSGVPIPNREKMVEFVQSWRILEEAPGYLPIYDRESYRKENGNQ